MKKIICPILVFLCACMVHAAAPVLSHVTVRQDPETLRVNVTYELDQSAIVTANVYTNGVLVPGKHLPAFIGDVQTLVEQDETTATHAFLWQPAHTWAGVNFKEEVRVELTAWPTNAPPDYLVVDLRLPHVRYFTCEDDLPEGGLASDLYRTDYMVFRRIQAAGKSFLMGAASSEPGWYESSANYSRETLRRVSFENDFYLAVFEMTQHQWWRIGGTWPSTFSAEAYRAVRPVETLSYDSVRGDRWPEDGFDGIGGALAALRIRLGFKFDLPTEAQWEFACRAGTVTGLNNGSDIASHGNQWSETQITFDPMMDQLGRYNGNGGRIPDETATGSAAPATSDWAAGTARVGSYRPNAWGLYDMHGNVSEFCLDWVDYTGEGNGMLPTTDTVEPTGPAYNATLNPAKARVTRGGNYNVAAWACRSAVRRFQAPPLSSYGFRLAIQK